MATSTAANRSAATQPLGDDLSALNWVNGELRRSLDTAHRGLRRFLKDSEAVGPSDVDVVDQSALRNARTQLHQGVGALELVGLPAAADVLRASEAAVQRMVTRPALVTQTSIETIESVSYALLDFIDRQVARKPVSPVMLFPQYRAALQLAGAERVHPADLWKIDWQWRDLPADRTAQARAVDEDALGDMEILVLPLMRGEGHGAAAGMSDLCADLGAGAARLAGGGRSGARQATFWQLAAAMFEAQAAGLLTADLYSKRIASRLLAQLRAGIRGPSEPSERLAQDMLFFCSRAAAPAAGKPAPRMAAVRKAWRLADTPTADYETPRLGRFDPAMMAAARKRVASAKDAWSAVAGGELHRLAILGEQFALVAESLQKLLPEGDKLGLSLQRAVAQTLERGAAPPAPLAMEVATAILYLDASLEDGDLDHPELPERVRALSERIDAVRLGADPQPLDVWMEELYRRVSDRQTMGSVVQELRSSLSEIEKQIDLYFRNPAERQVLIPVPAQLSAMRSVLSVLGLEQASQAALHMRDAVDALAQTEVDPQRAIQTGTFDHLAHNLGALSFLIDMISVQPQLAKSLFRFDADSGVLSAVMGQSERVSAFAALEEANRQAEPAPDVSSLLTQLGELARATARPEISDAELARRIEPLTLQALAADERELARLLGSAQSSLAGGVDAAARQVVRQELLQAVSSLLPAADVPAIVAVQAAAAAEPQVAVASAPVVPGSTGLEDDAEMRDIFIEEAREVIGQAQASLARSGEGDGSSEMTSLRRGFHTLKGSSRMVGLRAYGEAAWACEQLYNARLAQSPRMDAPLRELTGDALAYLSAWTEAIAGGDETGFDAATVARSADSLRVAGALLPIALPSPLLPTAAETTAGAEAGGLSVTPQSEAAGWSTDEDPAAIILPAATTESASEDDPAAESGPAEELPALPELALLADQPAAAAEQLPLPTVDLIDFDLDAAPQADAAVPEFTAEAIELDELDSLDLLPATSLEERVPGLPSAADLDLSLSAAPEPLAPTTSQTGLPDFSLDLGAFEEPAQEGPPAGLQPEMAQQSASLPDAEKAAFEMADLAALDPSVEPAPAPAPPALAQDSAGIEDEDDQVKIIGPLRISIPLFNIFLNEADELSRRLSTELAEWALESERHPVPESCAARAHSLAGNSATVGYAELSALARALEHALMRSHGVGRGRPGEPGLFSEVADEIRRLLHQFAAGFVHAVEPGLMERLADHERWSGELADLPESPAAEGDELLPADDLPAHATLADDVAAHAQPPVDADTADIDAVDAIDAELFPIFEEEAEELLPQLQTRLRQWLDHPADVGAAMACMRTLHTFKGGARLSGAMRLGEMAHQLETLIEHLSAQSEVHAADVEPLLLRADRMTEAFELLGRRRRVPPVAQAAPAVPGPPVPVPLQAVPEPASAPLPEPIPVPPVAELPAPTEAFEATAVIEPPAAAEPPPVQGVADSLPSAESPTPEPSTFEPASPEPYVPSTPQVDWARFSRGIPAAAAERAATSTAAVRVRAGLLDRLVNQAGEVSITRARINSDVKQLQGSLGELTDSLERMRRQLRDIELQAETQIASRIEAAKAMSVSFDPLEMDRFTRFQELTRFMAESVNDVATLQRSLQRTLQSTEDELATQARLTRELQDDLLRTRMIEFDSLADRLYRTVRQAAKDTAKQVRLDIVGGAIEIDRGVLERMTGPFEHLLRNSVAHGIETPQLRVDGGKEPGGLITITVTQAGNEVSVEVADDGGGIDLPRVRRRAIERGLLEVDAVIDELDLMQMIFAPGFSTAEAVTELAGRGVGLDVVRAEVTAMGGRIETLSTPAKGTRFKLVLPLTTAVTQVVMMRCGDLQVAVPSTLVELVRRVPSADVERAYLDGRIDFLGASIPFHWLPALLDAGTAGAVSGRTQLVVTIRSASQRVAVHVDEVLGNQEVVVKNVGAQLSHLPGLAGVTLLPSGNVALIYNPVALHSLYGATASDRLRATQVAGPMVPEATGTPSAHAPLRAPMVLVVDDSLTVRRVTQRLLAREGYRVVTAKDGMDALERLAEERPVVVLSDIEMPRMDGFDLLRNIRADARMQGLPVIMITSRTAEKHRDYAAQLGADHYLGKPYGEEELLSLVARYAGADIVT